MSNQPKKYIYLMFGLTIFIIWAFTSCQHKLKPNEMEPKIVKIFGLPVQDKNENPTSIIFSIDATSSMKGFVTVPLDGDSKNQTIEKLIFNTTFALGPIGKEYSTFHEWVDIIPTFQRLLDPSLYNGNYADFTKPLELSVDTLNKVLIIFTDLQFNNNQYFGDLVQLFQEHLRNGKYIKIFSTHAAFNGIVYPQFQNASIPFHYSGTRPIYAIAVGFPRHAKFIDEVLIDAMKWENTLTLSSHGPVDVKVIPPFKGAKVYNPGLGTHAVGLKMEVNDTANIKLTLNAKRMSEWDQLTPEEILIDTYSAFKNEKDSVVIDNAMSEGFIRSILYDKNNSTLQLTLRLKDIDKLCLARLVLRPHSVPRWVQNQSCLPSGDQSIYTLKFSEFIEGVLHSRTNPFTLAAIHIYMEEN